MTTVNKSPVEYTTLQFKIKSTFDKKALELEIGYALSYTRILQCAQAI